MLDAFQMKGLRQILKKSTTYGQMINEEDRTITTAQVEKTYNESMVLSARNEYLKHMWNRLDDIFTPREAHIARGILKHLSRFPDGLSEHAIEIAAREALPDSAPLEEKDYTYIMEVLKHDGYLQQSLDAPYSILFFTNLLKDFIQRRHAWNRYRL